MAAKEEHNHTITIHKFVEGCSGETIYCVLNYLTVEDAYHCVQVSKCESPPKKLNSGNLFESMCTL